MFHQNLINVTLLRIKRISIKCVQNFCETISLRNKSVFENTLQ